MNVMQKLFPLDAPIEIGAGWLQASNKLYTRHSVSDYTPPMARGRPARLSVWVFSGDGIVARSFTATGKASVDVPAGGTAIIAAAD